MTDRFRDKVVVVTGAGSGIGRALCQAFANEGAYIVATDVNEQGLNETMESLKGAHNGISFVHDVSDQTSWESLLDIVKSEYGRCDILCNNAGVLRYGQLNDASIEDWDIQNDVNVKGVIWGCKTMLPMMIAQGGGQIMNTASGGGLAPWPDAAFYSASKFAVVGFSETLQLEVADQNIHISILCPGGVATPMNDIFEGEGADEEDRMIPPEEAAMRVLDALVVKRTYIFTHIELLDFLEERHKAIVGDHAPLK